MSTHPLPAAEGTDKRIAILEQAIRTFAELGFRGTDVQVIADRAGVGKGTVYRYFGNKEDLFWATTLEVFIRLHKHLLAEAEHVEGALEILRAVSLGYAGFFEANPDYLEVFVQERAEFRGSHPDSHRQFHEDAIGYFGKVIEQGIADGEIRPVDARKTVLALGGVLYGIVVHDCYAAHNYTLTELTGFTVDTFLDGIRAKGLGKEGARA